MNNARDRGTELPWAGRAIALLALIKFLIQMLAAGRYGIFRDELYYLACAQHLQWGYVDHPPLIAFVTWFATHVFGSSLYGLRLLPALAGAGLVVITAAISRELGGGRFAQGMAAAAVIPVPVYLMMHHWLTMNAFEPLLWMGLLWAALRMVNRDEPRYWLLIGALAGVGLENKYSVLLPVAGLLLGLLCSSQRRMLRSRWLLPGVGIALLLFLPNFVWLAQHHFPFLEFERNSRLSGSRIERAPLAFIADQMVLMNPLLAPLWLGGLVWLLFSKQAKNSRWLAFAFLTVFCTLMLMKSKNYYVTPIYPVLFAAGAVAFEQVTAMRGRWLRFGYAASVFAAGALLAPFSLPVLPVEQFIAYQRHFGDFTPIRLENLHPDLLPQQFADEFGWEEMVRRTAQVYRSLPESERADTAIFGNNYGEAAAIDFFGPRYGLPPAIGKNESYWLWGPREYTGSTVIVLGSDGRGDRAVFRSVQTADTVGGPYVRSEERFNLYLCRDPKVSLYDLWPSLKAW
ncbi:MAG: glycosyltransferase family 39 protein [Edaphobacter sp.]|uniref:ArnT family glycosyltransferase n=1 Tax=Edaphobacter sp. TaxID=1934404 RepID=UPI00238EB78C|nr:glycosyltransferase family 39 protein [Edaphobacter sp.]MDE1177857.1 glycosyltransferase family 39 protein [Edaphobacter sp.]